MKRPELSDYGLTEKMIEQNKREHELYDEKLRGYLENRKTNKKVIWIISLIISGIFLIINMANGFETDFAGGCFAMCLFWDVTYGIYYLQTHDETVWDISYDKRDMIEKETINKKIDNAIQKYTKDVEEYEKKAHSVNEYSLVRAELLTHFGTSLGARWIVFSNIYLANPRSFPVLENPNIFDSDFRARYEQLTTRQRSITPKPKKCLNISDKMEFYYPCSELFGAMENKQSGDVVTLLYGYVVYKIIEVINPHYE